MYQVHELTDLHLTDTAQFDQRELHRYFYDDSAHYVSNA
jgi:hypothetical protein